MTGAKMTRYPCKGCPEAGGCTKTHSCPQWYAWFFETWDSIRTAVGKMVANNAYNGENH